MGKSEATVIAGSFLALSSLGGAYWVSRRVRRRLNQSKALRGPKLCPVMEHNAEEEEEEGLLAFNMKDVGSYVCAIGTLNSDEDLEAPCSQISCVGYERSTYRVKYTRTERNTGTGAGLVHSLSERKQKGMLGSGLSFFGLSKKSTSESFRVEQHQISKLDRTANGLHLIVAGCRVGLELEGAEFLVMEKVYDEVKDEPGDNDSVRVVEWVLKKNAKLVVCGELGLEEGSGLVLRRSRASHLLDLKTNSIAKPFLVSRMGLEDTIYMVERSGRKYICALTLTLIGSTLMYTAAIVKLRQLSLNRLEEQHLKVTHVPAGT